MQKLAAEELGIYLKKITGAELEISNTINENIPVKIYVGQSKYTDQMKVSKSGLKYGAFHIKSGKDWLVLLGNDTDFVPHENFSKT
ncbi:MAG: hypothetical protein ACYTFY_18415, partial [Planctomycetota bacterium]